MKQKLFDTACAAVRGKRDLAEEGQSSPAINIKRWKVINRYAGEIEKLYS